MHYLVKEDYDSNICIYLSVMVRWLFLSKNIFGNPFTLQTKSQSSSSLMLLFKHREIKPLHPGVWWETSVYYRAIKVTFKPSERRFLRVMSGNNNPITLCICQVKSLVCVSKGQKGCLNVFHLSEETQRPWSRVGTEESTLWHKACSGTATCHIWADFAGCRFQVLLAGCTATQQNLRSAPELHQPSVSMHRQGAAPHSFLWVPQLRSPQVCSEASASSSAPYTMCSVPADGQPTPGLSSLFPSARKVTFENPILY